MTDESGKEDDKGGEPADNDEDDYHRALLEMFSGKIEPPPALPVMTLIKDTLPLIGFLLLPVFALRALIAGRFDLTVATALVQFTQPLNFALAFLLSTIPPFIFAVGLVVSFWIGRRHDPRGPGRIYSILRAYVVALASSVLFVMIAFLPEWPFYLIFIIYPLVAFTRGQADWFDNPFTRLTKQSDIHVIFLLIIFVIPITTYQKAIWLAPESLTIRGMPKTEYVLQQQDQDLIVYAPDLNAVLRVPVADVSHRQFCNSRSFTVAERLFDSPQGRPPCPK